MTGQGAKVPGVDLAPSPFPEIDIAALETLDELSGWLGTFRERLRVSRPEELPRVAVAVQELEARFEIRRAELA